MQHTMQYLTLGMRQKEEMCKFALNENIKFKEKLQEYEKKGVLERTLAKLKNTPNTDNEKSVIVSKRMDTVSSIPILRPQGTPQHVRSHKKPAEGGLQHSNSKD